MPRLTLTLGLRYQMPGVVDERDSLELAPVVTGSAPQTLLSNATLNFAGASAGSPWYHRDAQDFAPNIGFAWDVFGNGKTAMRGGYSMSYVNDQAILCAGIHAGRQCRPARGFRRLPACRNRVSTGLPQIIPPTYQVPLTVADNYANQSVQHCGDAGPQPAASARAAVFHRHSA